MSCGRLLSALCLWLFLHLGVAGAVEVLNISAFGGKPNGSDTTPCVRAALDQIRQGKAEKLVFAPGRYDFWPDQAAEKYLFICNNDQGLKRIAFNLSGLKGAAIDGGGATFMFHGPMVPFLVEHSTNVMIQDLSFDFSRPFQSEGKVLAVTPESVDLEFSDEFPYAIRHGVLIFTDGKKSSGPQTTVSRDDVLYPYGNLLAFDPVKHETAFMARDFYELGTGIVADKIGPKRVRLRLKNVSAKPGNILVFGAKTREFPGVVISHSANVHLTRMNIYNACGMGVIGQLSADIFLNHVDVMPPPGGKRIVSVTADATHFVNCRGKVVMANCLFEQQMDDACNIHGIYCQITRLISPGRFEIRLAHPQQWGMDVVKPGTHLELTQAGSLQPLGFATVKSVDRLNDEYTIVESREPLPAAVAVGDCVADADANTADFTVTNCVLRGNRARGLLLGTRGKILIEGNTFHVPGGSILFEGDAQHWFEQSGVRDVVIRNNTFDNCNFGVWGNACIQVGAGIAPEYCKTTRYNRNILIEDNLFKVFSSLPLLSMYSVDGLIFRDNRLVRTSDYPSSGSKPGKLFNVTDSDHVTLEQPTTSLNAEAVGSTLLKSGG